jgi:hypothetical protein
VIIDITLDNEEAVPNRVFALGEYPEMAAGLWGYVLTPYFNSLDELEIYCQSDKGKDEINKKTAKIGNTGISGTFTINVDLAFLSPIRPPQDTVDGIALSQLKGAL